MCDKLLRSSALMTSRSGYLGDWKCQSHRSEDVCWHYETLDGQSSKARYCRLLAYPALCFHCIAVVCTVDT